MATARSDLRCSVVLRYCGLMDDARFVGCCVRTAVFARSGTVYVAESRRSIVYRVGRGL